MNRTSVWANRSELKGTRIWMKEDYPHEIDDRRKKLWPYFRASREGDPANPRGRVSAFMKADKLILNNQTFTSEQISLLPAYVQDRVKNPPAIKSNNDITVFFTGACELSNFYLADMEIDKQKFRCAEQYISFCKAKLFDTESTANEILTISDPLEMKQRVKHLKKFNEETWTNKAKDIL